MIDLWINEFDLKVYHYYPLPPPHEGYIWRRIPIPTELVKDILDSSPYPYAPLVYWADQWDHEMEEDAKA